MKKTLSETTSPLEGGFSAKELLEMKFSEPKWIVPGIIPEGATLLAGPAKVGKTFMALNLAYAVSTGGLAFGKQAVEKGRVYYLYLEGSLKVLQRRLAALAQDDNPPENLNFRQEFPRGKDGLEQLKKYAQAHPDLRLIVVDTLIAFRDSKESGRDVYKLEYETVKPFAVFAQAHDCAVLLITHTNKATWNDDMDSISGSMGQRAAVDTQAVLKKNGSGLLLKIGGRDMEEKELAFHFDKERYTIVMDGEASRVAEHPSNSMMRQALKGEEDNLSAAEIHRRAEKLGYEGSRQAAHKVLKKMAKDPESGVTGGGHDGYRLSQQE